MNDGSLVPSIDLIVLTRDSGALRPEVEAGILNQKGVSAIVHRVIGKSRPTDGCRWETIARARNEAKRRGKTPWLMFVDDDVVLGPRCVETLLRELERRPIFGALAADYLGQYRKSRVASHVGMGATLFRREVLDQLCKGKSYKMVADALSITHDTVRHHIKNIYKKLEVHSVSEAILKTMKKKLI